MHSSPVSRRPGSAHGGTLHDSIDIARLRTDYDQVQADLEVKHEQLITLGHHFAEVCAARPCPSGIAACLDHYAKRSYSSLQLREQLTATKSEMVDLYAQLSVQEILEGDDDPRSAGQLVVIRFAQPSKHRHFLSGASAYL